MELAVAWQPANGVGGDCFDTLGFGNLLGVSIADIAGKGLPAALLMSNLQAAVRAFAQESVPPVVDLRQRQSSAVPQHGERPLRDVLLRAHRRARPAHRLLERRTQPAAPRPGRAGSSSGCPKAAWSSACFPTTRYEQGELPLGPGDRLVFYTDGITEARNPDGEEYGEERLAAAALASRSAPVESMKDALLADVNAFTGGQFEDDATLIVVGIA